MKLIGKQQCIVHKSLNPHQNTSYKLIDPLSPWQETCNETRKKDSFVSELITNHATVSISTDCIF